MRTLLGSLSLTFAVTAALTTPLIACSPAPTGGSCTPTNQVDLNCDAVEDELGTLVPNTDFQVDMNNDGLGDGKGYDTTNDGVIDAVDVNGDGAPDVNKDGPLVPGNPGTGGSPGTGGVQNNTGGAQNNTGGVQNNTGGVQNNTGGVQNNTGGVQNNTGGVQNNTGGAQNNTGGTSNPTGHCLDETPTHSAGRTISGSSDGVRYSKADTKRNGVNYRFIANGWGPGWQSHTISYEGSRFSVDDFQGTRGSGYEPAGYPTVFCGQYSDSTSQTCGLPASVSSLSELDTGLAWSHSGNGADYNVAYDIWMGNGNNFTGFLMLWYRDPPQNQPAGAIKANNVTVNDAEGRWDVWTGQVNGSPIVNYVRANGNEADRLSFDVLDYVAHGKQNYNLPGDTVLAVAIGFEIWSGAVTNLSVDDFCVNVKK